jgi:RNA polymerase sigma-70 factor (ECF subfamily)
MSRHHARTDEELLVLTRSDADAFAELYDRHAGALADWLARRSPPDVAQELFAETFAQAWCARRRYRPAKGPARAWLYGIARHLLHDSYRRLAVEDRARRRLGVLEETAPAPDAESRLDAAAVRAELEAALENLPPAVRAAVVLRVVEQLDYDELAARLGCSSQAARLRVSRGLRALRRATSLSPILEGATA